MNIWIVDDETNLAQGLSLAFQKQGFETKVVPSLAELRQLLEKEIPALVFLDQRLPDGNGLDVLPAILQQAPRCRVVLMTAFGDSKLVVRAIREGAYNYLDKPFPLDAARNMAYRAIESIRFQSQADHVGSGEESRLLGFSPIMTNVSENIAKVAPYNDVAVLLQGESGTGKEVAARMLHKLSGCKGEFVAVNCAAIPESLLEAELFGYAKGAYTGAEGDKQGLIEIADGGTLFLDEIGDMPIQLQAKMLRFLDSRTFRPLGATAEKKVSLKVVCATCMDLEQKIADGTFRSDLFFRISTIPITMPPLRDRENDVLELAALFLSEFSTKLGRSVRETTEEVRSLFLEYSWPGNVRELRNLIERVLILKDPSDSVVRLADLPSDMLDVPAAFRPGSTKDATEGLSLTERIDAFEKELIAAALDANGGKRSAAADELGISRYSLIRRMQRHGLE